MSFYNFGSIKFQKNEKLRQFLYSKDDTHYKDLHETIIKIEGIIVTEISVFINIVPEKSLEEVKEYFKQDPYLDFSIGCFDFTGKVLFPKDENKIYLHTSIVHDDNIKNVRLLYNYLKDFSDSFVDYEIYF